MQVIHPVSECPNYNNNIKLCLTSFGMVTRGYTQHTLGWWLEDIFIGMITRGYVIYGHSDEILDVMELLMHVVHPISECPYYNNNLKFSLTNFGMMTRGYTQHSLAWWLEVKAIRLYRHSNEILKGITVHVLMHVVHLVCEYPHY